MREHKIHTAFWWGVCYGIVPLDDGFIVILLSVIFVLLYMVSVIFLPAMLCFVAVSAERLKVSGA